LPFFKLEGLPRNALLFVFLIKIAAGVAMYLVYTYIYTDRSTADIFKYFDDSKVMYDALYHKPVDFFRMITGIDNDTPYYANYYNKMNYWYRVYESNIYNDSHTIIRFNALLRLFSFGYYNVHTVFMCFFSLAGLTAVYRFFAKWMQERRREIFIAVFLLPSVLFWGSGVLKEGLLFFGLGMFIWHTELLLVKKHWLWSVIVILFSLILLMYTKFYIIIVLFPLMIAYAWVRLSGMRRSLLKFALVTLVALIVGLNIHLIFPGYDFVGILVQKQHDFINLARSVNSGSLISMKPLENSIWSLLLNSPRALYNSLFRPWFFEGGSILTLVAGFENLLIVILMIITAVYFKIPSANRHLLWLSLFFSLGILVLTGLTTPVMGAIVRYKVPALPFLLVVFIVLTDHEKLHRHLSRLKARIIPKKK
jgi:hypothetical protein